MIKIIKDAVGSAGRYCFNRPSTLYHLARHAVALRWAIPLDALRWAIRQLGTGGVIPEDITIEARPPAIFLGATIDAMGTPVRVEGSLRFDEIRIAPDALQLSLHLGDVDARVLGDPDSPLVQLLESGAIDLSRPANLVSFLPKRPRYILKAKDNEIVVDLMRIRGIAENAGLQRALRTLTPVVDLRAIRTERDMLIVAFHAKPRGVPELIASLRG